MTAEGPTPDETSRDARKKAYAAEYRRTHADEIAAYKQSYRAANAKKIADQQREYNARIRAEAQEAKARRAEEEQRAERRREYARAYYAKNREHYLDQQRELRAKRKARDPERYLAMQREVQGRWRASHKEERNAKLREKYKADPIGRARRTREYYAANSAHILAKRRERYAETGEARREYHRRYRAREARRRQLGLPARRIHTTTPAEIGVNEAAAAEFFSRSYPRSEVEQMLRDPTPPELLSAWARDCTRARALSAMTVPLGDQRRENGDPELVAQLRRRMIAEPQKQLSERQQREKDEADRMDAIARQINERLRTSQRRTPPGYGPAAPHRVAGPGPSGGLSR